VNLLVSLKPTSSAIVVMGSSRFANRCLARGDAVDGGCRPGFLLHYGTYGDGRLLSSDDFN
jgi:hypothetical protein